MNDIDDIMAHPYFASLNIDSLLNKTLTPPYMPEISKDHVGSYIKVKTDSKSVSDTIIPT